MLLLTQTLQKNAKIKKNPQENQANYPINQQNYLQTPPNYPQNNPQIYAQNYPQTIPQTYYPQNYPGNNQYAQPNQSNFSAQPIYQQSYGEYGSGSSFNFSRQSPIGGESCNTRNFRPRNF